jgi:hypothetical protein
LREKELESELSRFSRYSFLISKELPLSDRRQFPDTSSKILVHPPFKNLKHEEELLPMPVRSGDTISTTLLYFEDVRGIMDCEQPVGLNSDAIELRGLITTINGVWLV